MRDEASTTPDLAEIITTVTDTWDEPLDEVRDVPQIVNAILAAGWRPVGFIHDIEHAANAPDYQDSDARIDRIKDILVGADD